MLTQPVLDNGVQLNGLVWPKSAVYAVIYFSRSTQGVWANEPQVVFFHDSVTVDLWMFDLFTRNLTDETAFTGVLYLKGAATAHVFKYP